MKRTYLFLLFLFFVFISCKNTSKTSDTLKAKNHDNLSNKTEYKEKSLAEMISDTRITEQAYDYSFLNFRDSMGYHAVIRVRGYTIKDDGAANIKEDSLEFVITDCSDEVKQFLLQKRGERASDDNKNIYIDIAVPHCYDPGHIIKKSTEKSQVFLIINIHGDFNRGGWDNTNKVMMFQREEDLKTPYVDDYKQEDYDHYYDGV